MTKTELFEAVSAILEQHGVKKAPKEEILALLEPKKSGGKAIDPEDYTVFAADGSAKYLKCNVLHLWMPATEENFYFNEDGTLKYRFSRHGEKARKDLIKITKASKEALLADVVAGVITPDEAKAKIEEIESRTLQIPEGIETYADKPAA